MGGVLEETKEIRFWELGTTQGISGAAQPCVMCYGGIAHYYMFPNIFIETFGDGGPGEAYSTSDCCLDM